MTRALATVPSIHAFANPARFLKIARPLTPVLVWSGVVAEGALASGGTFVADTILAKHDERYMPPQVAGKMHKTETLEK